MSYAAFLEQKEQRTEESGLRPELAEISGVLFDFQRAIVRWAVTRGRSAIFADCGMGKTLMQLEWARIIGKPTLIVAPLGVVHQTIGEARKLDMTVEYLTEPRDGVPIAITNYERLRAFEGYHHDAIILDESSILKSLDGKTRGMILDRFSQAPFRLACTATPAPNDLTELGNHAQFLSICSFKEMSAMFFVKDSNSQAWRLKGHAAGAFYRWLASWCVQIKRPSDIGFDDGAFILPELSIDEVRVSSEWKGSTLFPGMGSGIRGRLDARRSSLEERVAAAGDLIDGTTEQWIVWCGLNVEGEKIAKRLGDRCVLIEGSMTEEQKQAKCALWLAGERQVMVTKPSIYGFGMNFQNCHRMIFLGLGDSYEQYYQAIRRCWRFGQNHPVDVSIVLSESEEMVARNVKRKQGQSDQMSREVIGHMKDEESRELAFAQRTLEAVDSHTEAADGWTAMLGDSCIRLAEVQAESVGLSVFSPPFVSLYTYTNSPRDMGNSRDEEQFFAHFSFIIKELLRVTMPGRNCCVHVSQVPAMLCRDGYIGMKDFRAATVEAFNSHGWIYHGEVVIDKDPQAQAIRTKSKGLLFVQLKKDSSWLRPALADYILVFRKPGENPRPIRNDDISNDDWIRWARPIWYGINETKTLNYREARTEKDERHICPLQLDVIERCVRLWSMPGDLVCSPFMGIGSEGHVAIINERRFVGCELKREYFDVAVRNLRHAQSGRKTLFDNEDSIASSN